MLKRTGFIVLGLSVLALGAPAAADVPVGVSPGAQTGAALVEARCPTFNWGAVAGVNSYELVVYRVGAEGVEASPVLRQSVPGTATGWTPSLERCLVRGEHYAWSVRAVATESVDTEAGWSEARLFRIAPGPTLAEVRAALAVLEEYSRNTALEPAPVRPAQEPAPAPRMSPQPATPPPGALARVSPSEYGGSLFAFDDLGQRVDGLALVGASVVGAHVLLEAGGVAELKIGVLGEVVGSTADSFNTMGVYGITDSEAGFGVRGDASSSTGSAVGVFGITNSSDGVAGEFANLGGGAALRIASGWVRLQPSDLMPACTEGNLYFDDSENWLCICDGVSFKRADNGLACS